MAFASRTDFTLDEDAAVVVVDGVVCLGDWTGMGRAGYRDEDWGITGATGGGWSSG